MAEVITLSSSEDENTDSSPPRKRIKPTPILSNLPQISITSITKSNSKQTKKQAVVVVCSDDDEGEEVTYIAAKDIEINNKTSNAKSKTDDILKVCDNELSIVDENNSDVEEVNDVVKVKDKSLLENEVLKCIDDSCEIINDDSCEESSGKENRVIDMAIKDAIQPCSSSTNDKSTNTKLLGKFIKVIDDQTNDEKYKIIKGKFTSLWNYYSKCKIELQDSTNFKNMLLSNIQKAGKSAALAVISFNDIFQHLHESSRGESIEVENKDNLVKLKKLEKAIRSLVAMIKQLGEEEINFDEEEDSSYLKIEKYSTRLDKVYKKYCEMLKKNPFSGRITHSKLDFVDSEFNEINRAISKKYKNNKKFPSYYEMEKLIQKVSKENNLDLGESKIKSESVHCFKKLGKLLQARRQKELYDSHYLLIQDNEDPAKDNPQLNETLKTSYLLGQSNIDKLVQEFVNKESSKGEEPEESQSDEESDKSNYVDSEDDEDEKD